MARKSKEETKKDFGTGLFEYAQKYAEENGVSADIIDNFFAIAQKQDVLTENDMKVIAEQAKFYQLKEDEDLSALKKKDNHKISATDVVFSEAGYKKAKMELYILKTWKLAKCEEQIGIARSYGDLSENAEYDAAKEEQTKIARRIVEIEENLKHAVITDNIVVVIREVGSDEEETYEICGTTEANPEENKISNQSPLAKALAGKKAGDIIEYEAPGGTFKFEVLRKDK